MDASGSASFHFRLPFAASSEAVVVPTAVAVVVASAASASAIAALGDESDDDAFRPQGTESGHATLADVAAEAEAAKAAAEAAEAEAKKAEEEDQALGSRLATFVSVGGGRSRRRVTPPLALGLLGVPSPCTRVRGRGEGAGWWSTL